MFSNIIMLKVNGISLVVILQKTLDFCILLWYMFVLHERGATYENDRRFILRQDKSVCENMIRGNAKYKDLLRLYSSNQEKLLSTLTEEQKERYEKIG